ncbi:M20/M25/M40 family metallo-hydrolase [Streptomyces uncialis]|uniref:M20/M25/M40 family metallo-hydrolase n=1 Tax=Streptomyces uncialis TaxID=1048205 RepID=UPI0022518787|nr:M20/M25/M40 family metallo-hydrolase [Streptomyces uncialis]MCX4658009.1 M20/M25/M40 family metallo-hydrolase [Streptomyces uncialis]
MTTTAAWVRFTLRPDDAHTLVVCVPPTGASGTSFDSWASRMPTGTALAVVDPPGRGPRLGERPVTDMAEYAQMIAAELAGSDRRLILVGVGLGGVIAYETCRALAEAGRDVALLCVVAGRPPSARTGGSRSITAVDARSYAAAAGLTAPEPVEGPEAAEELLLAPILADLRLGAGYDGRAAPSLSVPVRLVRGTHDPRVSETTAREWARYTDIQWTEDTVDGGHDIHRTAPGPVIRACVPAPVGAGEPSRRSLLSVGVGAVTVAFGATATPAEALAPNATVTAPLQTARSGTGPATFTSAAAVDPVALASAMIRHDTGNPGDGALTLPHARMLRHLFEDAGARTETVETPKAGNVHFFARVPAAGPTDKKPLLLLGHSDVVPAIGDPWTVDPFGGEVKDGRLYGRGALDMKGTNAAFAAALVRHLREGARFDREVIFWSDCDEEQGSHGVRWLLEKYPGKVEPGVVLTEGGWILNQKDETTPMLASLTCSDRRAILVQVETRAYATHTSKPNEGQAVVRLGRALELLGDFRAPIRPNALSRTYFKELSRATRDRAFAAALRDMLSARTQPARNEAGERAIRASGHPELHNAMMRTTLAFVGADAGYYTSIIPGRASARMLVGFLPGGDDPATVVRGLRELIADHAVLSVVARAGETEQQALERFTGYLAVPASTVDTDIFRMWRRAVTVTHGKVATTAAQFEAVTSAVPFREKGIPVYGMYPYTVDRDALRRMHGTDEYIKVEELRRGTETVYQLLAQLRVPRGSGSATRGREGATGG